MEFEDEVLRKASQAARDADELVFRFRIAMGDILKDLRKGADVIGPKA